MNRSCSALTNILSFARKNARKEKSIFFLRLVSVPYFSRLDKSARLGIPRGPWPSFPENPELIHRRRSSNFAVVCRAAERNPRCDSPRCAHFPSPRIDLEIHQFRRQYRQYPCADRNGWTREKWWRRRYAFPDPTLSAVRFNVRILPSPSPLYFPSILFLYIFLL